MRSTYSIDMAKDVRMRLLRGYEPPRFMLFISQVNYPSYVVYVPHYDLHHCHVVIILNDGTSGNFGTLSTGTLFWLSRPLAYPVNILNQQTRKERRRMFGSIGVEEKQDRMHAL